MTEEKLRQLVVDCAKQFEGSSELIGTHQKLIDVYNAHTPLPRGYKVSYTDPWCAAFVSAIAIMSGLTEIMPLECSCSAMVALFQKMGSWQEHDGYVPQKGDVVFYDWDDSGKGDNVGSPDHVGIVTQVTGDSIKVIEGNLNNRVEYRKLMRDDRFIRGYGLPDYKRIATGYVSDPEPEEVKSGNPELPMVQKGWTGNTVRAMQILLIGYGWPCGKWGADGDFGAETEKALRGYQSANGLDSDGICGPRTWAKLLGVKVIE